MIKHLRTITGLELVTAGDLVESTSDTGVFITFSGALKRSALKVSKIANDLRLLSSGPQAGFGEINLPTRQAGSSIMPGKVNPVIPEAVSQVAYSVAGADVTVSMAVEAGPRSVTVITALAPVIGYAPAAQLAKKALATNEPISNLVVEQGLLDLAQLDEILKPERLTGLPSDHSVDNTADSAEAVPRDEITSEIPVVPSAE